MTATPPWLKSLLEEHFEELQILWERRAAALRDADLHEVDIVELDDRIAAHLDGLLLGGEHAMPLLLAGLGGDEQYVVFAATYVLLHMGSKDLAERIAQRLADAEGPALDGLREALCFGPTEMLDDSLRTIYESGSDRAAATAAEVFAFRGRFRTPSRRLAAFLSSDDPTVRRAGWRIVALVDG